MNKPNIPLVDSNKRLWETNSTSVAPYGKMHAVVCSALSTAFTDRDLEERESE